MRCSPIKFLGELVLCPLFFPVKLGWNCTEAYAKKVSFRARIAIGLVKDFSSKLVKGTKKGPLVSIFWALSLVSRHNLSICSLRSAVIPRINLLMGSGGGRGSPRRLQNGYLPIVCMCRIERREGEEGGALTIIQACVTKACPSPSFFYPYPLFGHS